MMLLVVLPNVRAYAAWRTSNTQDYASEEYSVQLGLALRTVTRPFDSIALAAVGGLPYFAQRTAVDLLGVNDGHIARESPKTLRFHPGHTKWDYPYSIDTYKPTIVYSLYSDPSGVGEQTLMRAGYRLAAVDYSAAEESLDHLPNGLTVYVSPAMATRLSHVQALRHNRDVAPVTLDLVQASPRGNFGPAYRVRAD